VIAWWVALAVARQALSNPMLNERNAVHEKIGMNTNWPF
jgi:hypothetical protein